MLLKVIISGIALSGIVIHALFPAYRIDIITIGLFIIAVLPWLSSLVDSFELPGGWKLKFKQLEAAGKRAEQVGLLSTEITKDEINKYSFQAIWPI